MRRRRLLSRNVASMALREENVLRQAETGAAPTQSDRRHPGDNHHQRHRRNIYAQQIDSVNLTGTLPRRNRPHVG